jgi:aspartate/glutamate racemase
VGPNVSTPAELLLLCTNTMHIVADHRGVIRDLVARGAQGIVLGCTEIELLVRDEDADVPLFPTTRLHVAAALDAALLR